MVVEYAGPSIPNHHPKRCHEKMANVAPGAAHGVSGVMRLAPAAINVPRPGAPVKVIRPVPLD